MSTTPPAGAANGARSHLSVGSNITGELQFPGLVEVAGQLQGQLAASAIMVEETAVVEGDLSAKTVQIKGRVQGRISGGDVRLMSSAQVSGDILYDTLSIDSGAEVHAACKMRGK
jgi:cytoskeletal protein CcmA (bactofilin family)